VPQAGRLALGCHTATREKEDAMWILFTVPCPTPDGRSAEDLYRTRLARITDEMQASARELGCRFHRAWYSEDGSAFYALANWESREGASAFFRRWDIADEPGEVATTLLGDVGLVPEP
jgi:hypothetical protein